MAGYTNMYTILFPSHYLVASFTNLIKKFPSHTLSLRRTIFEFTLIGRSFVKMTGNAQLK